MAQQQEIKKQIAEIKAKIEQKHGKLKAFRAFPKGHSGLIFKGRVCPDLETYTLYKKYTSLILKKI